MRSKSLQTFTAAHPALSWRVSLSASAPIALTGLTLAAFALRLLLLDAFPLREDEAIYGVWARSFWRDPWFLSIWPDKPPLFLWLQAFSLAVFGPSAAAVRMVSIAASTLIVPLTAIIARRLWGDRPAIIAALLLALNPFAISFGPTGYTDSLLTLCGMASLCCALYGRPGWAGFWLGAAIMTKQQGVLYAPLILACVFLWPSGNSDQSPTQPQARARISAVGRWVLGLVAIVAPVMAWDAARWATAPSPWDLGVRNYGRLTLATAGDWGRLTAWGQIVWHLTASWLVWAALAGFAVSRLTIARPRLRLTSGALIALWAFAFFLAHVVTTVPPWDRYLLPLTPLLALAGGWLAAEDLHISTPWGFIFLTIVGALLLPPALNAARGGLPIGGDHGDLTGLNQALSWIENVQPGEKALYHRVVSWHAQFYLFDQVQAKAVDLRWFSDAPSLADNAAKTPHLRKFLVEPDWAATRGLSFHLAVRGFGLLERAHFGRFVVYELTRPPQPDCVWCVSRAPGGWLWATAPGDWSVSRP